MSDENIKIYIKQDDFDFDIVHFRLLDGVVLRAVSYGKLY